MQMKIHHSMYAALLGLSLTASPAQAATRNVRGTSLTLSSTLSGTKLGLRYGSSSVAEDDAFRVTAPQCASSFQLNIANLPTGAPVTATCVNETSGSACAFTQTPAGPQLNMAFPTDGDVTIKFSIHHTLPSGQQVHFDPKIQLVSTSCN